MVLKGDDLVRVRTQAQSLHLTFPDEKPRNIAKLILSGAKPPKVELKSLTQVCAKAISHYQQTSLFGGDKRAGKSGRPRTVRKSGRPRTVKIWREIDVETCKRMMYSIPLRLNEVIKNEGRRISKVDTSGLDVLLS